MNKAAIALIRPKYIQNLASAVRACACWDVSELRWSGDRMYREGQQLPRELRMREYSTVNWKYDNYPITTLSEYTPVAVELVPNAEDLHYFIHPSKALYIFGPEDGSLDRGILSKCHKFVQIPSKHCLNLAATINVILWDRQSKLGEVK